MFRLYILSVLLCLTACACNEKPSGEEPGGLVDAKDVTAYVTTNDLKTLFKKSEFDFSTPEALASQTIRYDKSVLGKEVDGFGLALTTASCYNLMQMNAEKRTAFLKEMFSPTEGVGSSLIRVSIGASDFCLHEEYTWCDKPGLENFAVHQEDKEYLFPILKEVYAINPDVKIIASPWSCPRWMKCKMPGGNDWDAKNFNKAVTEEIDNNSWTGGRLKPSCYDEYAEYFVKWVQVME